MKPRLRTYIRQHGAHRLKGADMNELDALFVSTRDNQPLVFVYGTNPDPRRQSAVIGYEQSAVDGKRTVGYRHGTAELVDDARFAEIGARLDGGRAVAFAQETQQRISGNSAKLYGEFPESSGNSDPKTCRVYQFWYTQSRGTDSRNWRQTHHGLTGDS